MSGTTDRRAGKATRNLAEGVGTFVIGLALWLFTEGVEVPVVTLTKVGVAMMCVGGVLVAAGLCHGARGTTGGGWPLRGSAGRAVVTAPRPAPTARLRPPCSPSSRG